MSNKPSLIRYPLFRLSVSMAAGIFLFDRFLPDIPALWVLYSFLPLIIILLITGIVKSSNKYVKYIFGITSSFCFLLLGGALVLHERNNIEYKWSDDECFYYGKIMTAPENRGKTFCSTVNILYGISEKDSSSFCVNRDILLYWIKDSVSCNIKSGDNVLFYSQISQPVSDSDFMGFDYRRYLLTKGVSGTAFAFPANMLLQRGDEISIKERALRCRDRIVSLYSGWNLDDDNMAVVSALTIGDKSGLSDEIKDIYSAAGTSHVLALSGLHIGIFSAILYFLLFPLKKIKNGRLLQSLIVASVLWVFAFVSGLSPSVVRAVTMCSLYLLASLLVENGLSGLYSLTFTAFIMLLYQPMYLFDISFQLSFVAVFSIILFFPYIDSLIQSKSRIIRYLWGMMAVSLSAQLGTLPLILYYFGSFPTYFLLANLIVTPLAVCILSLTLASLLLMWVPYLGDFFVEALNVFSRLLNDSMSYICSIDGAQITSININEIQMVFLFIMTGCIYMYFRSKRVRYIISMLLCLCVIFSIKYYKSLVNEPPALYLAWSELYLKDDGDKVVLESQTDIYSINGLNIGVMKTDYWKNKELKHGEQPLSLDYVYFCRGFKGDLKSLSKLFKMKRIILDNSLSDYYKEKIKVQSKELNIPVCENSGQASFKIVL